MGLRDLISDIEELKYEDNYGVTSEQINSYRAGIDDALEQLRDYIQMDLPRTEILAFAGGMEAEMSRHDAEKGDSWKDCELDDLHDGMGEAVEQWWNNYEYGYEQDADHYLDIANFCMKLWNKAKSIKARVEMGDCGCSAFNALFKIKGPGKTMYIIDIYPSCKECFTPAGVILYKMDKKAMKEWNCENIPELEFPDECEIYIPVLYPEILKSKMLETVTKEELIHDEYDAQGYIEDCLDYGFIDAVRETTEQFKKCRLESEGCDELPDKN